MESEAIAEVRNWDGTTAFVGPFESVDDAEAWDSTNLLRGLPGNSIRVVPLWSPEEAARRLNAFMRGAPEDEG